MVLIGLKDANALERSRCFPVEKIEGTSKKDFSNVMLDLPSGSYLIVHYKKNNKRFFRQDDAEKRISEFNWPPEE